MQKINKLILNNFKFFYGSYHIDIETNNLLLFGENGSGKSSIYWSLYTFFQSVYKNNKEIEKYFDPANEQNLINRFAIDKLQSSIMIEFKEEDETTIRNQISLKRINTKNSSFIQEAAQSSDFINYRLLSRLYDFSNKDDIDLFNIFELEILRFITFRKIFLKYDGTKGTANAHDWWEYIKAGLDIKPKPRKNSTIYKSFGISVEYFNEELNIYLKKITESVNKFLQEKFEQPLKIDFRYKDCTYDDFININSVERNNKIIPPKIILEIEFIHSNLVKPNSFLNRPQSFLNEAKLTAIALSIRFAVLNEKLVSDAPKILVLDDLLLSLDMNNRDYVLDIILDEFKKFQLLILTHDKLFFEMVKHKVNKNNNSNWKYYELYESIKDNIPRPLIITSESYLEKAEKFFYQKEYDAAGNFLRKEAEAFCKEFLPLKKHYTTDYTLHNLNGLITQCKNFANDNGLDSTLFQELDDHRKFVLNPTSHDSYEVPKYFIEIEKCIKTIKNLRRIFFKSVFKKNDKIEFEFIVDNTEKNFSILHTLLLISDIKISYYNFLIFFHFFSVQDKYKFEIDIHDDFRIIYEPCSHYILSKGMINYRVFKNNEITKNKTQHGIESIQKMYDDNYVQSIKTSSPYFWEGIIFTKSQEKLRSILN